MCVVFPQVCSSIFVLKVRVRYVEGRFWFGIVRISLKYLHYEHKFGSIAELTRIHTHMHIMYVYVCMYVWHLVRKVGAASASLQGSVYICMYICMYSNAFIHRYSIHALIIHTYVYVHVIYIYASMLPSTATPLSKR